MYLAHDLLPKSRCMGRAAQYLDMSRASSVTGWIVSMKAGQPNFDYGALAQYACEAAVQVGKIIHAARMLHA
ncbi:hypothetical protein WI84_06550 [Burkholderia ubonensis]|uniref:hypothetical protein n=1 Tax=Burkholderia ubonensis TaxID=101571 RepID=UPI000752A593|nr:hypothetical protein [Burkholderia ubonensis]KVD04087.1 hypothetical protein WI77_30500 [Burkholderia ubonensis]KVD41148.1 hypothetical protein WI84_06550 [Burkholderia ubonensis]